MMIKFILHLTRPFESVYVLDGASGDRTHDDRHRRASMAQMPLRNLGALGSFLS